MKKLSKSIKTSNVLDLEPFLKAEKEKTKDRPNISTNERLIWFLKTLLGSGTRTQEDFLIVPFDKLLVEPYFYSSKDDDIYSDFYTLIRLIQSDKDFFRKHNMQDYKPNFVFDIGSNEYLKKGDVIFSDFTHDLMTEYLEDRLGVKYSHKNKSNNTIQKIEILEDKEERGRIKVYINGLYEIEPLDFARKGNWQLMYKVANKEYVEYNKKGKAFYDYFNCNQNNSLYKTHGFKVLKVLKEEDGCIVPNVEIKLITQNKITRRLKST